MSGRPTRSFQLLPSALAVLALATAAAACLWDSDTLRHEAKGLPGVVDIIVGRFDREPPLYYEIRLARVAAGLETEPDDLAAYDDAGVACDRLRRPGEAIDWMARKRARLDALAAAGARPEDELAEHEYRYHANLGTFLAHRWFAAGAGRDAMEDLRAGRDHIARAIELNPDAHFGRERYQLLFMEWLLDPPEDDWQYSAPHIFAELKNEMMPRRRDVLAEAGYDDAVEGLTGLIALGAAWESVDVYVALGVALGDLGHGSLCQLTIERATELIEAGRSSLHPQASASPDGLAERVRSTIARASIEGGPRDSATVVDFYSRARASADERHERRTSYMLARLNRGEHPDTHEAFWAGYREPKAPALPAGLFGMNYPEESRFLSVGGVITAFVILAVPLILLRLRRRRLRRVAG